jgi:hypothetical protein
MCGGSAPKPKTKPDWCADYGSKIGPTPSSNSFDGLSGGAIAGIVIGCVVVVGDITAALIFFLVIKKGKNDSKAEA